MKRVEVPIAISARHIHLNQDTYNLLFDHELTIRNKLNQVGQFAANETVTLKTEQDKLENVRIVGPLRSYNQVEISKSDARRLGIMPPVRKSGDLKGALNITVETPINKIEIPAVIIANRHIHMNPSDAKRLNIVDGQMLKLEIKGDKSGILDIQAKVSDDGYLEVHLDTDDANAFLLNNGDMATLII